MFRAVLYCTVLSCSALLNMVNTACSFAQAPVFPGRAALQDYTEHAYGPDDLILQGRIYTQQNIRANGHPYFYDPEWKEAILFSHGRSFSGRQVRYDIEREIIILQTIGSRGGVDFVCAEQELIDSLSFAGHLFINLGKLTRAEGVAGYYELVYRGGLLFVLKHSKSFIKNYNSINPNGYYTAQVSKMYLVKDDRLVQCPNRKLFLQQFEPFRKELKKYIRQQHIHYRKAGKEDLALLCRYADQISRNGR